MPPNNAFGMQPLAPTGGLGGGMNRITSLSNKFLNEGVSDMIDPSHENMKDLRMDIASNHKLTMQ